MKNILVEEAYTGVLNNHRREYNNGKAKHIDKADWYRHEDFFPVIIEKQEWEQVQRLLKRQARPANGNQAKHRYAGLLTCRECVHSYDPLLERQESCGICMPWISSEWKNLLLLPLHS